MAEANCTWCVAGKYQSGSGLNAAFGLALLTKTLGVLMHVRANEGVAHCYILACV
jgi:hypothetical protein